MMRCEHCGVALLDTTKSCPLCKGAPTGNPVGVDTRFPMLASSPHAASRILLACMAFGSACVAAICITINMILPAGGWWSLFVVAGIASLWIDFIIMLRKRKNLPKSILWQVAVVSLIAFVWDRFTGFYGWSVDYVLPILCTCAMVGMTLVAKIRKLHIQDYILYLVMVCILGIMSFVLLLTGTVTVVVPAAICFCTSFIFFAALLFFEGKALWAEIQRRLHL